jgi:cellulose synthase/poly-beta-1,6-N-acetylglucosamine synthase-like glycosyltransferase
MIEVIFWFAAVLLVYLYAGYPLMLICLGIGRRKKSPTVKFEPSVSLVISAHNEEAVIRDKIENSLRLDYPRDRLEILIASDASTDRTNAIVNEYSDRGVRLVIQDKREGKTAVLNVVCPIAKGELVVLSDADGMFRPDAIKKLARRFADPEVGCVAGALRYVGRNRRTADEGESFYLRYDAWIKKLESRIGSVIGAFGGIFAFRRNLFEPMDPILSNDLETPLQILRRGYKVLYEEEAVCVERASPQLRIQFERHARISARAFYGAVRWTRCLLNPFHPLILFQFVSKKLLRWLSPLFFFALLITPFFIDGILYQTLRSIELLFLLAAAVGGITYWIGKSHPIISLPFYLIAGNLAVLWGFVKFVTRLQGATWAVARDTSLVRSGGGSAD